MRSFAAPIILNDGSLVDSGGVHLHDGDGPPARVSSCRFHKLYILHLAPSHRTTCVRRWCAGIEPRRRLLQAQAPGARRSRSTMTAFPLVAATARAVRRSDHHAPSDFTPFDVMQIYACSRRKVFTPSCTVCTSSVHASLELTTCHTHTETQRHSNPCMRVRSASALYGDCRIRAPEYMLTSQGSAGKAKDANGGREQARTSVPCL